MKRVKLADLPIKWLRGNGYKKADLVNDGEYGCILYGELFTKYKSQLIQPSNISRTNRKGNIQTITGDILIPGTSTAKKSDMVLGREVNVDGVFLGGDINVLRPQQGLFAPKFLPYFLESQEAFEQLEPYIKGATGIIHLSNTGIKSLKVPLPPLAEQQRIVAILDEAFAAIDQAKANTERNLKNAKELFESYLQGVFENGKEIWEEKTLDEVCQFRNGAAHEQHIDENGKYILVNSKFISADGGKFKRTNSALAPLYINDIAFVMSDVPNGKALAKCFLVDKNDTYTLNQRIGAIKSKLFIPEFLVYQFNRNKYLLSFNNGENQTNLRKGDILKCPLWLPSKEEQQTIVRQLDALRAETQKLETVYQKKLSDLDELKKSILQKAFAGELTTA